MERKGVDLVLVFLLFVSLLINLVYAEKLGIEIGNSYIPGDTAHIKITLYDDDANKIQGVINYRILNYYSEVVEEGKADSGKEVLYELPANAWQGPWKVIANYNEIEINSLFNVGELAKAEIVLEGDILTLRNIGNAPYNKKILIYIGDFDQTADVFLDIGQVKRIRLTAPDGEYDVRVVEGNEEQVLEFDDVSLTGNVIGLERVLGDGFWKRYPIVGVFLIALVLVVIVIIVLKIINRKK